MEHFVMSQIIMGYWNCESCGTTDIEGLIDVCPSCGARKPAHTRYHMKGRNVVTAEALANAGIGEEECDGEHKEWVCAYCGYLNNYSAESCYGCGASKEEAKQEYGDEPEKEERKQEKPAEKPKERRPLLSKKTNRRIAWVILTPLIALFALIVICMFPFKQNWTVVGFRWEREITVEQMQTVKENGWSVPEGGRVYKETQEIKSYERQISHYEEVVVTRSRQVIDYYDTEYRYVDNGNGTFTEESYDVPVYTTEYYDDIEKQPVYIDVPVYATMYYYEIDRWFDEKQYLTEGMDHNAYWDETYTLTDTQRDEKRREEY